MVRLSGDALCRYERLSVYNSPYPAHDRGCAVDLYPGDDRARSPVAGEVLDTRTVRCPPKDYAGDRDHLVLVDVDAQQSSSAVRSERNDLVARILHVDPSVEAGDRVAVGDLLGTLVRSGFFGRWVDNHIHLGFRDPERNVYRASGSLPLELGVDVEAVPWDGTGRVAEVGQTYTLLDAPSRPSDAKGFVALASDEGVPLDGGLTHYTGGGAFSAYEGELSLLGAEIGVAQGGDAGGGSTADRTLKPRDVTWNDVEIRATGANGSARATGLSLFASQVAFGAKLVFHEGHEFEVGEEVSVSVGSTPDPIQLS